MRRFESFTPSLNPYLTYGSSKDFLRLREAGKQAKSSLKPNASHKWIILILISSLTLAVAANTVREVADPFFTVLTSNISLIMAGIAGIVV